MCQIRDIPILHAQACEAAFRTRHKSGQAPHLRSHVCLPSSLGPASSIWKSTGGKENLDQRQVLTRSPGSLSVTPVRCDPRPDEGSQNISLQVGHNQKQQEICCHLTTFPSPCSLCMSSVCTNVRVKGRQMPPGSFFHRRQFCHNTEGRSLSCTVDRHIPALALSHTLTFPCDQQTLTRVTHTLA